MANSHSFKQRICLCHQLHNGHTDDKMKPLKSMSISFQWVLKKLSQVMDVFQKLPSSEKGRVSFA